MTMMKRFMFTKNLKLMKKKILRKKIHTEKKISKKLK